MFSRQLIGFILALFVFTVQASASTYDATLDFSSTDNPNGEWSYGWSSGLGTGFDLDTEHGTFAFEGIVYPGLNYWARNSITYPIVLHNGTSQPITIIRGGGLALTFQPGDLVLHPGADNSYSLLRWTAPHSGGFDVHTVFMSIEPLGATTDVHVLINDTAIFNGYVNGYGDISQQLFSIKLNLESGDAIDFAVGAGGNGYYADSTAVSATITANPVPIPSAILLFGTALVGLEGLRLKRKNHKQNIAN